jgi:hypothetical protein
LSAKEGKLPANPTEVYLVIFIGFKGGTSLQTLDSFAKEPGNRDSYDSLMLSLAFVDGLIAILRECML